MEEEFKRRLERILAVNLELKSNLYVQIANDQGNGRCKNLADQPLEDKIRN